MSGGAATAGCARGRAGRVRAAGVSVDPVERCLEDVGVRIAAGEAHDYPSSGADDPSGDVEQDPPECVGVTAPRCALGCGPAGGGDW